MPAKTSRTATIPDGTFEPIENFGVNLRQLAHRLVELHAPPEGGSAWPFVGPTPVSDDERKALVDLAFQHYGRHDIGKKPIAPRCENFDRPCKAWAAAKVVLSILWAPGDETAAAPARRLDKAVRRVDSALVALLNEVGIYNAGRAKRHAAGLPCTRLTHARYCDIPAGLPVGLKRIRDELASFRQIAVLPQFPRHSRGADRLGLLKWAELALAENGWRPQEIIAVLDDGNLGTPRARKDRLRKRLAHGNAPGRR